MPQGGALSACRMVHFPRAGSNFKGMNRQDVLKAIARIMFDCGLLCKPENMPEQAAKAVQANQLATPAAGYFLTKLTIAVQKGSECWYTEDGIRKTVAL